MINRVDRNHGRHDSTRFKLAQGLGDKTPTHFVPVERIKRRKCEDV